jgi:gamma-butyrobetaine dioxygenase
VLDDVLRLLEAAAPMAVPARTASVQEAGELVGAQGAAILTGRGPSSEEAVGTAEAVFAGRVLAIPEAAEVRAGGVRDHSAKRVSPEDPLQGHTDGFAYGDNYPDYLLLLCAHASPVGGESFLVDCLQLVESLSALPEGAELAHRLETVPVDQTEEGMHLAESPLVARTPAGRRMFRRFPFQRPAASSADPEEDQRLIDAWSACCAAASARARRFKLEAGEALIVDNYRVLHGREPYADVDRLMWRVWVWSDESAGLPPAQLHSDTRYARTA